MKLSWQKVENGGLELNVPIRMYEGEGGNGNYFIRVARRPSYCDRGDWIIYVDGRNDLDYCDGFPRYFFGSEEEVKQQMETWLCRRSAYKNVST